MCLPTTESVPVVVKWLAQQRHTKTFDVIIVTLIIVLVVVLLLARSSTNLTTSTSLLIPPGYSDSRI